MNNAERLAFIREMISQATEKHEIYIAALRVHERKLLNEDVQPIVRKPQAFKLSDVDA